MCTVQIAARKTFRGLHTVPNRLWGGIHLAFDKPVNGMETADAPTALATSVTPFRIPWLAVLSVLAIVVVLSACRGEPASTPMPTPTTVATPTPTPMPTATPVPTPTTVTTPTPTPMPTATPVPTPTTVTTPTPTPTPEPIPNVRFVAISSGENHTCALREDGAAVCWGFDDQGEASPPEGERFGAIDSGALHSCGLREDGSVSCWGVGNYADAYPEHERFVSIDVGFLRSCGIREDGVTVCWTSVYGTPETLEYRYSSVSVSNGAYFFGCGLIEDGSPVCLDLGLDGEVMDPPVEDDERFASISSGLAHVCALRDDGTLVCWGADESGQASPPQGEEFASISSGRVHTCALRDDGTPVCWGNDESGQASPPQGEAFTAISGGGKHTCALRADGSAVCWGNDYYGQSLPTTEAGPKPEPDYPVGELLWRFRFPVNEAMASRPTVADGVVYITLYDNSLHALDASTGSAIWSHQADGWITSSPVVVDGVVYAGSWDGYVYALDAVTGNLLWRFETAGSGHNSLKVSGDVVYAEAGGSVYALQASTGELIWSSEDVAFVYSISPVQAGEVVYAGSAGILYALDSSTGEALWQHKASGEEPRPQTLSAPEVAVVGETVYIGPDNGHVRALDASTGDLLWEYETPARVALTPVVDAGVVYAAAAGLLDGSLYALNAVTGDLLWEYTEIDGFYSLAVSEGLVYVSGHIEFISHVFALDSSTGEFRWRAPGSTALDPFVVDSAIYATYVAPGEDGPVDGVSALDAETGEILWVYHTDVGLGRPSTVADGVVYVSPTENYYDSERGGYTGWYLYALTPPRTR